MDTQAELLPVTLDRRLLKSAWGTSENNRRAKFYQLTLASRKRLRSETESWNRLTSAMAPVLNTSHEEA